MEEGPFHLADLPVYSVRLQSFVRLILILSDDKLAALTDDTIFSLDIGEKEEDSLTMDVIMHLLEYARLELVLFGCLETRSYGRLYSHFLYIPDSEGKNRCLFMYGQREHLFSIRYS